MATKNLLIRGGADFSGMKKEMQRAQKALDDFQNKVSSTMKKIGTILGTLAVGKLIKDSTQMAMSVESATDNIRRNMGEAASAFEKWAKTQSQALGMGRADAYKYGSTFSNLLSSFSSSAEETAKNTQDLMKAAAIIASKTGRTYEDAAERIRSGMLGSTEAIEDLGVYVNISMIESTEAFRKFAGDKSWSQLDFQTQQQIRLAAILEQTYARYGDTLADTTQTRHAQFVASLQNIKLSLGQAFLPIYNAVLPALTAMANAIGRVVNVIAQFFQALFGSKATKQATQTAGAVAQQAGAVSDLGNALGKAGKAAKKAQVGLAGFDEITNIKGSTTSSDGTQTESGGVGGIAAAMPGFDTTAFSNSTFEVSEKVQEMAQKVRQAFSTIANFIKTNKEIIVSAIGGIVAAFVAFKIITNWQEIVTAFSTAVRGLGAAFMSVSWPVLAVAAAIGALVAGFIYLWQTNEGFRDAVLEAWNLIKETLSAIVLGLWETIKGIWDQYGADILAGLKSFVDNVFNSVKTLWESFLKPIFKAGLEFLSKLWNEHLKKIISQVLELVAKLIKAALDIYNKFISPIVNWLIKTLSPIFTTTFKVIFGIIGELISIASGVVSGVIKTFGGLIDFLTGIFTDNWKQAWEGVKEIFKGIFDSLWSIVKWPLNKIIDGINVLIGGLNKLQFDVPDWIPFIGGKKFGFNIPKIPKLAQGGYVGANNPMLAIIGDNRTEGEIVAPESKIYEQAFRAISDALRQNGGGNLELTINLGSARVFHEIIRGINNAQRQAGRTLLEV